MTHFKDAPHYQGLVDDPIYQPWARPGISLAEFARRFPSGKPLTTQELTDLLLLLDGDAS